MSPVSQKRFGKLFDVLLPIVAVGAGLAALTLVIAVIWFVHSLPAPRQPPAVARLPQPPPPARAAAASRPPAAPAPHHSVAAARHPALPPQRAAGPRVAPVAQAAVGGPRQPDDLTGENSDRAKNRALGQALSRLGGDPGAARRLGLPP